MISRILLHYRVADSIHEGEDAVRGKIRQKVIRPRLELRTFCVLDRCDNQLRHRTYESHVLAGKHTANYPKISNWRRRGASHDV
jgi:hypothetical protein